MSWRPDGLFLGDGTTLGDITFCGADVPELADKLEQLRGS